MKKIVWKGFFEGSGGYINATKKYPLALMKAGMDVGIIPMRPLKKENPLNRYVVKDTKNCFTVLHQTPNISPNEEGYFTVTEMEQCPPSWWKPLDECKVILTQSEFCKSIFSKVADKDKIHVVHFPLDYSMQPLGDKLKYDGTNYRFTFGSVFQWVARKKPELMWQAFMEEFPLDKYPEVGFVNKISIPGGFSNWKWMFNEYTKNDPRINCVTGHIDDMPSFYRGLDCYCSPTAGEGWGATLCEAMACGIPTIGSRHSGNLDFMNDSNSYLVEVGDWEYIGEDPINTIAIVHSFQKWKLPKISSIRKQMRAVYSQWVTQRVNKRAKMGEQVREMLSLDKIGEQLKNALSPFV